MITHLRTMADAGAGVLMHPDPSYTWLGAGVFAPISGCKVLVGSSNISGGFDESCVYHVQHHSLQLPITRWRSDLLLEMLLGALVYR